MAENYLRQGGEKLLVFVDSRGFTLSIVLLILLTYLVELYVRFVIGFDAFVILFTISPNLSPSLSWILGLLAHKNLGHMGTNLALLLVYGGQIERLSSRRWYLLLFFGVGLAAALIHTNITGYSGFGSSSAVFGLLGFWTVAYFLGKTKSTSEMGKSIGRTTAFAGPIILAIQAYYDFVLLTGTAGYAHIAGAIIGGALAIIWNSDIRDTNPPLAK